MPEKDLPTVNRGNRDCPSLFSARLNKKERNALERLAAGQPGKPKSLEKYKTTQLELPFVLPIKHRGQYSRTINCSLASRLADRRMKMDGKTSADCIQNLVKV